MSSTINHIGFNWVSVAQKPVHVNLFVSHPQVVIPDLINFLAKMFPLEITQLWRGTNLPSKNFAILLGCLLDSKIAQSMQAYLPQEIVQSC